MPNAVVVAGTGVKGISVEVAVGFTAVAAAADAPLGVVEDCVTLAAGLAVCGFLAVVVAALLCDFLAVLLSVVVFIAVAAAVEVLAALVVAVLVVVVVLVTALVAGAVLAVVVSETVLVAANA